MKGKQCFVKSCEYSQKLNVFNHSFILLLFLIEKVLPVQRQIKKAQIAMCYLSFLGKLEFTFCYFKRALYPNNRALILSINEIENFFGIKFTSFKLA